MVVWVQNRPEPRIRISKTQQSPDIPLIAKMNGATVSHPAKPKYTAHCMFFFKKRPDQTTEECWSHWRDVHAPLCVPWLVHHNFITYQQVELQGRISPSTGAHAGTPQDFDGIALFEAPSTAALDAAFADPFWADVIAADVGNFTDRDGLFQNGIVAQFRGGMTTAVRDGRGAIEAGEGWRLWEAYQATGTGGKAGEGSDRPRDTPLK